MMGERLKPCRDKYWRQHALLLDVSDCRVVAPESYDATGNDDRLTFKGSATTQRRINGFSFENDWKLY
jgi:hypothetical protein